VRCLKQSRLPPAVRPLSVFGIDFAPTARFVQRQGRRTVRRAFDDGQLTRLIGTWNIRLAFF